MTPELIAILAIGVALAAFGMTALQVMLKQFGRVDARFDRLEGRVGVLEQGQAEIKAQLAALEQRMAQLENRVASLEQTMSRLDNRITASEQSQAHLTGMLDGLREAIFDRATR